MRQGTVPDAATRWARYRIGYHFVWIPKYRRRILTPEVEATVKAAIASACETADMALLALETDMDHVHAFVSAKPSVSPADAVRVLKGASSRAVRKQHPDIASTCGERALWAQSYYVGTTGDMSAQTVRHYIEHCQGL